MPIATEALNGFEEYLQASGGGDKPAITTGKMVTQFRKSVRPSTNTVWLAAALSHHHDPLPDITRQMIENGLSSIRDYMSAIDIFFDVTETDYKQSHLVVFDGKRRSSNHMDHSVASIIDWS